MFFWHLLATYCFSGLVDAGPESLPLTSPGNCLRLHAGFFSLLVSVCVSSLLITTPLWPHLNLITSTKILFPDQVTFWYQGVETSKYPLKACDSNHNTLIIHIWIQISSFLTRILSTASSKSFWILYKNKNEIILLPWKGHLVTYTLKVCYIHTSCFLLLKEREKKSLKKFLYF